MKTLDQKIVELFSAGAQGIVYRPYDFSTLFKDFAGTIPVTAIGDPVGKMLDCSGNGYHATQSTDANRPVLQQDGNGKYYLATNGTNSRMVTSTLTLSGASKVTISIGARRTVNGGRRIIAMGASGTTDGFTMDEGYTNGSNFNTFGASLSDNTAALLETRFSTYVAPITGTVFVKYDRTLAGAGKLVTAKVNNAAPTIAYTANYGTIGAAFADLPLNLFSNSLGAELFAGNFYGAIILFAATTAENDALIELATNTATGAY